MTRSSNEASHGRRGAWLWTWLGSAGLLAAAGCLVPDTDYCAYAYGDESCPAELGLCVLAKREASHEGVMDGCSAELPEGFVHVKYGLPTMLAAPTGHPDDPRSVEAQLARLGYEDCGATEELEASLGLAVTRVAEVRRYLEQRGRVRRAAVALSGKHVHAIVELENALDAWVWECQEAAIEAAGGSTGAEDSRVDSSTTNVMMPTNEPGRSSRASARIP